MEIPCHSHVRTFLTRWSNWRVFKCHFCGLRQKGKAAEGAVTDSRGRRPFTARHGSFPGLAALQTQKLHTDHHLQISATGLSPMNFSYDFLKSLLLLASTRSSSINCHSPIMPYIIKALLFVLNLAISASSPSPCVMRMVIHLLFPVQLPCTIDDFTEFYLIPSQSSLCKLKSPQWLRPCSCPTCLSFPPSAIVTLASSALNSQCWVPEAVQGTEGTVPGHSSVPGLLAVPFLSLHLCREDFSQKIIHTASSIFSQISNLGWITCEFEALRFFFLHCI